MRAKRLYEINSAKNIANYRMKTTSSFVQLVDILNDGHYHDGTTIGETLNITRSAIWKAIKKLQNYGVKVDSIKGKGYSLLEPLILLNQKLIKQNLSQKNIDITIFETINSTNDFLKKIPCNQKLNICLAEQQTQGKGRLGRNWHSPFGQNIYLSCAYPFQKDVSELAGLSLVVSLAIVKTLENYGLPNAISVKWPNDIFYDHKKISGNLIEIQAESHGICHAIIGIGINVNMMEDEEESISQPWISLRKITASYIDRNQLCILLIENLMNYLKQFEEQGLPSFIEIWNAADILMKKEISLKTGDKKITGKAMGINNIGHLILKLKDGTTQTFSSGDTTVLK